MVTLFSQSKIFCLNEAYVMSNSYIAENGCTYIIKEILGSIHAFYGTVRYTKYKEMAKSPINFTRYTYIFLLRLLGGVSLVTHP